MRHRNILAHLPWWLSRWFGYRSSSYHRPPAYLVWFWSFIGAFCGLSVIQAVFEHAQYFTKRKVPGIVASYGASAVLVYGALEAPLAQPRALFGGHFIGALTGTILTKLFQLLPTEEIFNEQAWVAGSLSCATAIVIMQITETTHPPAGATALLPAINKEVRELGWYYLPIILLSSTLAFAVALVVNNIQQKYPAHWFTPAIPYTPPQSTADLPDSSEIEGEVTRAATPSLEDVGKEGDNKNKDREWTTGVEVRCMV